MSRDHYKGVPKTRDAVIDGAGEIKPLAKQNLDNIVTAVDYFKVKSSDSLITETVYARLTGDDSNGTGTLENPYRTFIKCMEHVSSVTNNVRWVIDITGIGTETYTEKYHLPIFRSNIDPALDISPPVDEEFVSLASLNIFATPTDVETVSVTSSSTNATTSMKEYTDSSKSWAADAYKGMFAQGANQFEFGTIYGNTSDTIQVASSVALASPITIVQPSAVLKFGPASDPFAEGAFAIHGAPSSIAFGGIGFDRNSSSGGAFVLHHTGNSSFILCDFKGGFHIRYGGYTTMDACHIDNSYAQDGSAVVLRQSFLHDIATFSVHGDGGMGLDYWLGNRFENMSALGHGGNAEGNLGFTYEKCSVVSGTGVGIDYNGGSAARIVSCEILDCASHGVEATGPGRLSLSNVDGTGNASYGVRVNNGSQVSVTSTTAITGDSGDFKVGVLADGDWTSFNAGFRNQIDTTATSGTLARIFDASSY
jgi:hypothetical protein